MNNILNLSIDLIKPNPFQPRHIFDEEELMELANSIKKYGVLQPLLVTRESDGTYSLIAGERRWRSSKLAGLTEVPCVLGEYDDKQKAEIALIENLQRSNLHFLEEAVGMRRLLEEFKMTQEALAANIGKSQSAVANKLRLLKLDDAILAQLMDAKLSERHARALLRLDEKQRPTVLKHIISKGLNVKQTDDYIDKLLKPKEKTHRSIVANDVRIYLNSFKKLTDTMNLGGITTKYSYVIDGDDVVVTIRFPNKK